MIVGFRHREKLHSGLFSGAVKRFVNPNRDPPIMDFDSHFADDDNSDIDNGDDDNGNGSAYGEQTWRRPSYDPGTDGCSVALCFYRPDMH